MPILTRSNSLREISSKDQPGADLFNYLAGIAEKYEKEEDQENQSIFLKKMLTLFYLDQNQNHSLLIKCLYRLSVISIDTGDSQSGVEYLKLLTSSSNEIEQLADAKIIYEAHDKIASIYQEFGKISYAIYHLEVALFMAKQLFGEYSHQVVNCHTVLGKLNHSCNNEFLISAQHFEEALSIGRVLYKNDHKLIADLCIDIGLQRN
ncbi:MAG: hypothetical protein P8P83_05545 [Rickettsiaceae bacterium]|nr:hypothetical protein [Rickettsiaceae bacterium]